MRNWVLAVALVVSAVCTSAQTFESEGLPSLADHRSSAWYSELHSSAPNVHTLLDLLQDAGLSSSKIESREHREAVKFIAKNWHIVNRRGFIDVVDIDRASTVKPTEIAQTSGTWRSLGPFGWDTSAVAATGSMGIGVVRSLARHPRTPETMFAGTISGGIWRSEDAGLTWRNCTDPLRVTEVSDIVIAPSDTSFVYAATNYGVIRSLDGGLTFENTNLGNGDSYPFTQRSSVVAASPSDPFVILASYEGQLHRSTNGGTSWTVADRSDGEYWDLAWHPQDENVVYALKQAGRWVTYHRSTDGGKSFQPAGQGLPIESDSGRIYRGRLATSVAAPNRLWVLYGGTVNDTIGGVWGLYTSFNSGETFDEVCCGEVDGPEFPDPITNPNIFDYSVVGLGLGQITWDMIFAVSSADTSLMVAGGIFPYVSRDGGRTWKVTDPMHYDVQDAVIIDTSIIVSHDGGLAEVQPTNRNAIDRSFGICALEVWGFGQSHVRDVLTVGAYHMPTYVRDKSLYDSTGLVDGWYPWSGADAMSADVNPDDDRWIYAKPWSSVRGDRSRSTQIPPRAVPLGIDLGYIPLTNVAFHPNETYTIIAADHSSRSIARSTNNASTWQELMTFDTWISHVKISQEYPNWLAAIGDSKLMVSSDNGATWADRSPGNEFTARFTFSDVEFDESVEGGLWVSYQGHQNEAKVVHSTDGGETWTRAGEGLPPYAIRSMETVDGDRGLLFVGTELGVYVRSDDDPTWKQFGEGLPATPVKFLHVDDRRGVLRAGTSRGIWEIDLPHSGAPTARIARDVDTVWCSETMVRFSDRSAGAYNETYKRRWIFPGGTPWESFDEQVDVRFTNQGRYEARLIVETSRGRDSTVLKQAVVVMPFTCEGVDSVAGNAADLSGDVDYVLIDPIADTLSEFTFSAWVRPNGYQPNFSTVFCSDEPGNRSEIGMQFIGDSNNVGYLWSGGQWWWNSGLRVEPDVWSHVAMIVDSSGATVMVNGVPRKNTAPLGALDVRNLQYTLGTYHFWVSRNANIAVDEIRMYQRAMSTDEVRRSMYHPATPDEDLIGLFQFNEPPSSPVFNRAATGQGEFHGDASTTPSGFPFGPGVTSVVEDASAGWVNFPGTFVDLDLKAPSQESILLARIDREPENIPAELNVLGPHQWVMLPLSSVATIDNIRINTGTMIRPDDATTRTFSFLARESNSVGEWSDEMLLDGFPPRYDSLNQRVRYWTDPLTPSWQFVALMDGTPVSVEEFDASSTSSCTFDDGEVFIYDVGGSLVSIIAVHANKLQSTDVENLPYRALWAVQNGCVRRIR